MVRVLETRAKGASAEEHVLWSGEPFGAGTTLGGTDGIIGSELKLGEAVLAPAGTVNPSATVIATVGSVNLHLGHRHSTASRTLKTTVRTCG